MIGSTLPHFRCALPDLFSSGAHAPLDHSRTGRVMSQNEARGGDDLKDAAGEITGKVSWEMLRQWAGDLSWW
jgi:hypothetical protein